MPEVSDYKFIDGLRGLGALCVYFCHFYLNFIVVDKDGNKIEDDGDGVNPFLAILLAPLSIMVNGTFWVMVFFLISGFVLPLRYFKSKKHQNFFRRMLKRYLRLMIPMLMSISVIFTVVQFYKTNTFIMKEFIPLKTKTFGEMLIDSTFWTWFG